MAHFRKATGDVSNKEIAFDPMEFQSTSMMLRNECQIPAGGPFVQSNCIIQVLFKVVSWVFFPWSLALDGLLSKFIHTTDQRLLSDNVFVRISKICLYFVAVACLTPVAIVAFIFWCPLQLVRPRSFTYISPKNLHGTGNLSEKYKRITTEETRLDSATTIPHRNGNNFSVVSSNVCLMPEFVAHINNLHHSVERGKKIANYFCGQVPSSTHRANSYHASTSSVFAETDFLFSPWSSETLDVHRTASNSGDGSLEDNNSVASTVWSMTSKEHCVCDSIPGQADFICLQEVFDSRATKQLTTQMKNRYPFIVYDVSWPLHDRRLSIVGSGLAIASKYPFIDVCFKAFPDGHRDDKLACKGLLMTKLYLGRGVDGNDQVGYLANTHLQAWPNPNASKVRCRQLDCIIKWLDDFVSQSSAQSNNAPETTLFNIIAGDFNFDKVSHYDKQEQACQFLQTYIDHCMNGTSGQQHSWVVGTELNQNALHNNAVTSPQGLQRMLVSELERQHYVASTMANKYGSLGGTGDGKRRIDYILYKPCEDVDLIVKDYKFFTGLATLSDHIPIGMMFSCDKKQSSSSS